VRPFLALDHARFVVIHPWRNVLVGVPATTVHPPRVHPATVLSMATPVAVVASSGRRRQRVVVVTARRPCPLPFLAPAVIALPVPIALVAAARGAIVTAVSPRRVIAWGRTTPMQPPLPAAAPAVAAPLIPAARATRHCA